eukprot:g1959.t1
MALLAHEFERRQLQINLSSAVRRSEKLGRVQAAVPIHLAAAAARLGVPIKARSIGLPNTAKPTARRGIKGKDFLGSRDTAKADRIWYFTKKSHHDFNTRKVGPLSRDELLCRKDVTGETLVFRKGMNQPRKLNSIGEARNFLSFKSRQRRDGNNIYSAGKYGRRILASDFLTKDFKATSELYRTEKHREATANIDLAVVRRGRPTTRYKGITNMLVRHQCHRMEKLDPETLKKVEDQEKSGEIDAMDLLILKQAGADVSDLAGDIEEMRQRAKEEAARLKAERYAKSFAGRFNTLKVKVLGEKKTKEELQAIKQAKLLKAKIKRKRKRRIEKGKPPDVQPGEIDTDDSDLSDGELQILRKRRRERNERKRRKAEEEKKRRKAERRAKKEAKKAAKEAEKARKEWEEWQKQQAEMYGYGGSNYTWAAQGQEQNYEGKRNAAAYEGKRNAAAYEGKRNAAAYEGKRNAAAYEGKRNAAAYEGKRNAAAYESKRNAAAYEGNANAGNYAGNYEYENYEYDNYEANNEYNYETQNY